MVYYYTSAKVKIMKKIINDYEANSEASPDEYMKTYIEKCPETIDDAKISWIVETFLGIQKNIHFLRAVAHHLSKELSEENHDYFIVVFYGIIFHISTTDMQLLYKCLFNLDKSLLNIFLAFLGNNEVCTLISQIAQVDYDIHFITRKIIQPLFVWHPYIIEMANIHADYLKKSETRKVKLPTVPTQPNVLNRKGKDVNLPSLFPIPEPPPNSFSHKTRKMLTKSTIDQRLNQTHNKNRQKALQLLAKVKNKTGPLTQGKSDKYYRTIFNIKNEINSQYHKPITKSNGNIRDTLPPLEVKATAATIKRMTKKIQIAEQQELQWLHDLLSNCRNTTKIEELEEYDRQEKERERLIDIEKKHLMGQLSYEEAVIAKNKLKDSNKKKYEEFLKEKQSWEKEIENWKKVLIERNRKMVENLSLLDLHVLESKNNAKLKKKELADNIKKESEYILSQAMKEKQKELDRRINMIKEIKILSMIAKKAKLPKIIDLTESSGLGLLCEMSIAELQERLSLMKITIKEELENKKRIIKEGNITAKEELEKAKVAIKNYKEEHSDSRKQNRKTNVTTNTKEIDELKRLLEEKKKLRTQLKNNL